VSDIDLVSHFTQTVHEAPRKKSVYDFKKLTEDELRQLRDLTLKATVEEYQDEAARRWERLLKNDTMRWPKFLLCFMAGAMLLFLTNLAVKKSSHS
jgi:hypothetical protein